MKGTAVHVLKLQATPTAGPLHARAAYAWSVETSIYVRESERKLSNRQGATLLRKSACRPALRPTQCLIASPVVDDEYLVWNHNSVSSASGVFHGRNFKQMRLQVRTLVQYGLMEKIIADHPQTAPM